MARRGVPDSPLVTMGQSDTGGSTTTLLDTLRLKMSTLSPTEFGDAYLRLPGPTTAPNGGGYVGKIERLDPSTGTLYLSPAAAGTIATTTPYEIWQHGIRPDEVDRARDRALTARCSEWRTKVLSVLAYVSDWSATAYSGAAGGVVNATAAPQTMDFPDEIVKQSQLVTNSGANGYDASASYYVQPQQQYRIFGFVSVRAQTASVRLRDITNGADIALQGQPSTTFTGRGWQYFEITATIPAGCFEVQLWLGGTSAACIGDWAGLGFLPLNATVFTLPARVRATEDIGSVYVRGWSTAANQNNAQDWHLTEIPRDVENAAARIRIIFSGPPAVAFGVYYQERHFFDALQTDYYTAAGRLVGDNASTDCPLEYIEAATVSELLREAPQGSALNAIYLSAERDLNYWERQFGPEPKVLAGNAPRFPRMPRM